MVDSQDSPEDETQPGLMSVLAPLLAARGLRADAKLASLELSVTLGFAPDGREADSRRATAPGETLPPLSPPSLPPLFVTPAGAEPVDSEFESLGPLGEGGMGRVELVTQRSLRRQVAVKSMRPDRVSNEAASALVREARITGSLEHPNIVPVHAIGRSESGLPLIVMKHIDGVPWSALIHDEEHRLWRARPGDRLAHHIEVLMQAANAVHFAHSRGVVHRDLKPDNVMLGEYGEVYVVDWGVAAHLDDDGRVRAVLPVGTPAYMAPEQAHARGEATPRTDVYLLGGMLHEALTGRPPNEGATLWDVMRAAAAPPPCAHPPSVPPELGAICARARAADPAARFASALEFRQALADYLLHRGSFALTEEAERAFEELRGLADPSDVRDGNAARARRLGDACRLAFRQALREWGGNRRAAEGLRRCVLHMVEYEIALGNAPGAEALLDEISDPPPSLTDRIAALRRKLAEEAAARERLLSLEREMDFNVSRRARTTALLALAALGVALLALRRVLRAAPVTHHELLAISGGTLALMSVIFYFARRWFTANRVNRQLVGGLAATIAVIAIHRAAGAWLGHPVPFIIVGDLHLVALGVVAFGLLVDRVYFWLTVIVVLGIVGVALLPRFAIDIFGLVVTTELAAIALLWSWASRRAQVNQQ